MKNMLIWKKIVCIFSICISILSTYTCYSQNKNKETLIYEGVRIDVQCMFYGQAYEEISQMISNNNVDLKRAVFLLEWAYLKGKLDYNWYCYEISRISEILRGFINLNGLDKVPIGGMALFEFFTNPSPLNGNKDYIYDFEDFWGRDDYTKMFVTKLMRTHTGQCRSLPLLYKILSNEIGSESYIAYAPNHSFIRHRSEDGERLMCIELTNQSIPREVFIIDNMGITQTAIDKGTYMKPCDDREIAINILSELPSGYTRLYGWDEFVKLCYETALKYSPNNLSALMVKNNYLFQKGTEMIEYLKANNLPCNMVDELEEHYWMNIKAIENTGHVDMPAYLYEEWVRAVEDEISRRNDNK